MPSNHDFNARSEIPYYYSPEEKHELLRNCLALKDHRVAIAAYFDTHEDAGERGNFIRSYFDSTYVEHILTSGQRVGYRAYEDLLTIWRGSYLSREKEVFLRWNTVANTIYGMMLMEEWLAPEERPLPSEGEQLALIEGAGKAGKKNLAIPQAAIDYVLCSCGDWKKFSIYEYMQSEPDEGDAAKFFKSLYGQGGRSDAIPGSNLWEDYDGKGITIKELEDKENRIQMTLQWPKVVRRVRELIKADRYLSASEKERYPAFLREGEARKARGEIAEEFRAIVREYKDTVQTLGKEDLLTDR